MRGKSINCYKTILINLFLFIFPVLFLTACSHSTKPQPDIVLVKSKESKGIIQIAHDAAESIGLETEIVNKKKVNFDIKYNGTVKPVPAKTFFISSPVNGRIKDVFVEPNQLINTNQPLAEISSQDIAELQFNVTKEKIDLEGDVQEANLELELAKNSYEREKKLFEDGITAKKDFLEAENNYKIVENKVQILKKKEKSVIELAEKRLAIFGSNISGSSSDSGLAEIKSPLTGLIIKRLINPGEVVEKDTILFEAANLSEVFLESKIYEKDLPSINSGKKVVFTTEALPGAVFHGEINYISQIVDPETRTITVRAKVQNPGYRLKPEMFGKMFISISDKDAIAINKDAIQKVDNENVVYIKKTYGFRETKIRLGKETDGLVEVISGVEPGQEIVTKGSFWLKSELHTD